jgi:hypothetical protein
MIPAYCRTLKSRNSKLFLDRTQEASRYPPVENIHAIPCCIEPVRHLEPLYQIRKVLTLKVVPKRTPTKSLNCNGIFRSRKPAKCYKKLTDNKYILENNNIP